MLKTILKLRMMNLKSKRLILKEVSHEDLEDIHILNSFPEVDEFNTRGIPKDLKESEEWLNDAIQNQFLKNRKLYCWSIRLQDSNTYIGEIGMNLSIERFKMAEIYYNINPHYWGNGYATEAAKTILNFGFTNLKLHRIEAGVATENVRSIHVLEKLGMTREGRRRKILPIRGEWKDNYHYAILEEEFKV